MDSFEVIVSPKALFQLYSYIDYIHYTLKNPYAAMNVWQDAVDTVNVLKRAAGSLRLCSNPRLKELGYHQIPFLKHDYVMLYRIVERIVFVDAVYHLLQDYENTFCKDID